MVGDQEMSSESLKPFGRVEAKLCCLQIEAKITFRKTQANFGLRLQKIQLQSLVVVCISHSCTKPVQPYVLCYIGQRLLVHEFPQLARVSGKRKQDGEPGNSLHLSRGRYCAAFN